VRKQLALAAGQISLRLAIERWTDERSGGWFAGDVRALELSPHAALLEGAAEALAVVQLLACERPSLEGVPPATPNLLAFSGDRAGLRSPECLVAVNTLNVHPVLGTVALLNCHRPVYPLRFGKPDLRDDWSVSDWCDQCHRKKGLVVWPDLPRLREDALQGEALAAMLLGKIDAFEVGPDAEFTGESYQLYYRLLNCGLRPALVGGSGKDSNAIALGTIRTYAALVPGEELDAGPWIEAVRAGRTYVTNGPLLSLTVENHGPGGIIPLLPGQEIRIRAEARSAEPLDTLEVLAGGEVIASGSASGGSSTVVELSYSCQNSTWIVARCRGQLTQRAHTSPLFLQARGRPAVASPDQPAALLAILERTANWVEREADCPADRQRQHLLEVLGEARSRLQRLGGEPA
jgi:hypothetical protein